jgi:hypothetical protein
VVLVEKSERRIPHGRLRFIWVGNIKMHHQDVRWDSVDGVIYLRIGTGGGLF